MFQGVWQGTTCWYTLKEISRGLACIPRLSRRQMYQTTLWKSSGSDLVKFPLTSCLLNWMKILSSCWRVVKQWSAKAQSQKYQMRVRQFIYYKLIRSTHSFPHALDYARRRTNCMVIILISEVKKHALAQLNAPGLKGAIEMQEQQSDETRLGDQLKPIEVPSDSDDDQVCIQIGKCSCMHYFTIATPWTV